MCLEELGEERGEAGMAGRGTEEVEGPATLARRSTGFERGVAQSASEWARIEARCRPNLRSKGSAAAPSLPNNQRTHNRSFPPFNPDPTTPVSLSAASGPTASLTFLLKLPAPYGR